MENLSFQYPPQQPAQNIINNNRQLETNSNTKPKRKIKKPAVGVVNVSPVSSTPMSDVFIQMNNAKPRALGYKKEKPMETPKQNVQKTDTSQLEEPKIENITPPDKNKNLKMNNFISCAIIGFAIISSFNLIGKTKGK